LWHIRYCTACLRPQAKNSEFHHKHAGGHCASFRVLYLQIVHFSYFKLFIIQELSHFLIFYFYTNFGYRLTGGHYASFRILYLYIVHFLYLIIEGWLLFFICLHVGRRFTGQLIRSLISWNPCMACCLIKLGTPSLLVSFLDRRYDSNCPFLLGYVPVCLTPAMATWALEWITSGSQ
jgi:hypothetical protein